MKRYIVYLLVLLHLASLLATTGCTRTFSMKEQGTFSLREMPDKNVKSFTVITFKMNPLLYISEGGENLDSWSMSFVDPTGKIMEPDTNEPDKFKLAQYIPERNEVVCVTTRSIKDFAGWKAIMPSRSGKFFFNAAGKGMEIEDIYGKYDDKKYGSFASPITEKSDFVKMYDVGHPYMTAHFKRTGQYQITEKKFEGLREAYFASSMPVEQWLKVRERDSSIATLKSVLLEEDWQVGVSSTIPFAASLVNAGIWKTLRIPGAFFDKYYRTKGYTDFKNHDMMDIAQAVMRYASLSGGKITVKQVLDTWDENLPQALKIHITSDKKCGSSQKWGEYWMCIVKDNSEIDKFNDEVEKYNAKALSGR